jgi:hypothetical protein
MPAHALYERHRPLLDDALQALSRRGHWSPFPEAPSPKVYAASRLRQRYRWRPRKCPPFWLH